VYITVSQLVAGHFVNLHTANTTLSFTLADIQAGYIQFAQDGSSQAPRYRLDVTAGQATVTAGSVNVVFSPLFIPPPTPETTSSTSVKKDDTASASEADGTDSGKSAQPNAQTLVEPPSNATQVGDAPSALLLSSMMIDNNSLDRASAGWSMPGSGSTLRFAIDARAPREWRPDAMDVSTDSISGSYSWNGFLQSGEAPETLRRNLDSLRNQLMDQDVGRHQVIASTIAMSTGLSVGYVIWLVRGGALLGSMLSTMPMWQMIDPLPVLTRSAGSKRYDANEPADDASVEQIFDGEHHEPAPPPPPQPPRVEGPQKLTPEATP
jgi:hypothetical protein